MPHYDLTEEAEQDIREIVRYTFRQWGETQVRRYQQSLTEIFDAIADGTAIAQTFSENLPDVLVCCCEQHYIFYTSRNQLDSYAVHPYITSPAKGWNDGELGCREVSKGLRVK